MVALAVLVLPIPASAGLVEALSGIFSKNLESENLFLSKNIQNMSLLVALSAPSAENEHFPIIDSDALVPETGPLGSSPSSISHKSSSDQISVYVVHKGDTLSQIAEMFGVTVNTIKWGNNLSSNILKEGTTLVILPISGVKYTVIKGDTFESIAKKYKGDINEIIDYNDIQKNAPLAVGSVIIIPDGEVLASPTVFAGSSGSKTISGSKLKEYSGYYMRPVVGGRKSQGIHGYNGIDLASSLGTPILAAADGEVIISRSGGWNGGYGSYLVIKHGNGTQTLYAHNNKNNVSVGDSVKQGDTVAFMGATGKVTGVHLHFEIRGAKNPF